MILKLEHLAGHIATAAVVLATVAGLIPPAAGAGPKPISEGTLITRLGSDTLSIERFERFADRITGRMVRRVPRTSLVDYDVALTQDGRPRLATFRIASPPGVAGAPAPRTIRVTLRADSAVSEEVRDTLVRRAWALPNAFITMADSYGLAELWLAWLRALKTDTATVVAVAPLGGIGSGRVPARRGSRDSVYLSLPTGSFRILADSRGRLLSLDGTDSPVKHLVTRVKRADLDGFAARSAALDAQGRALGAWVSPRDTVRATIGACSLWVDYGRPSKRGRKVFEHGVLGDTLWRTGANAATQFRTNRDLVMAGRTLPAGKYTLWTRVTGNAHALLVNAQTGQWGTVHDSGRDLLQLPLEKRPLAEPVETFTIRIQAADASGGRGSLHLQWDDAELVLPFEVKP
ncbi:MAG: DUF2911 domain-containing protein [Candidatus Eisenbacteria bacterium]